MERRIPAFSLKAAGPSKSKPAEIATAFQDHEASPPTHEETLTPTPGPSVSSAVEEEGAWLLPGLVVRLLNHSLNNGAFFHQVGIVRRTVDVFGGEVHMETGDVIVVDQEECEPVLPAVGQCGICVRGKWVDEGKVRVVAMGKEGEVEVELEEGKRAGHRLLLSSLHVGRHIAIN